MIPFSVLTLLGCSGISESVSSDSTQSDSSSVTGSQTLAKVLDYFEGTLSTAATYNFFNETTKPRATTVFLEDGCFTTYRNFSNLTNSGMINISSELATKKGVASGVYTWAKEDSALSLGEKIGDGTYQDLYHTPSEISANKTDYIHSLHHESETNTTLSDEARSELSGNFTLNKDGNAEELLISFAKSLGVYDIIYSVTGMELTYANIYFGPISATINVTFYSQYQNGYSSYETSVTCNQFGTAKINELTSYIEA